FCASCSLHRARSNLDLASFPTRRSSDLVFDEERFVDRGRDIQAFDTRYGRVAILICEDAWHSITGTIAALQGAQLVIECQASSRSEEHTSELQSHLNIVCRLLLEKQKDE